MKTTLVCRAPRRTQHELRPQHSRGAGDKARESNREDENGHTQQEKGLLLALHIPPPVRWVYRCITILQQPFLLLFYWG